MKTGLIATLAIARKDLMTELRTKESINAAASFSLVILVLFSFAFDLDRQTWLEISGGLLWLVYSFAGALIVNRSFSRELPNDCLDVLVASPAPPWALFLGKALAAFFLLLIVEMISMPVFGLFYNVPWWEQFPGVAGVLLLGTWGIAVVGAAFSAVTVNVRLRELMLPVLLYPILIPLLIGAMSATTMLFGGNPDATTNVPALKLMTGFDIIYTALGLFFVEFILVS
jgi:heme exporter protein B